jgi:segregation and condensation protein B
MTSEPTIKAILEAALLAAQRPLPLEHLGALFPEDQQPSRIMLKNALHELEWECQTRGIELIEVATGYRLQVKTEFTPWIKRLWTKRPPRYSQALLETLAIIAYRQPIIRSEIESIRGVSVSSAILKTLADYQWIRILAYKDAPGKPALYGTTKAFLDHFGLKHLHDLPPLADLQNLQDLPEDLFAQVEEDEVIESHEDLSDSE